MPGLDVVGSALLAALILVSVAPAQQPGPLVGKPLPALSLSHSLQGEAWSREALAGAVIVLDVFQLG